MRQSGVHIYCGIHGVNRGIYIKKYCSVARTEQKENINKEGRKFRYDEIFSEIRKSFNASCSSSSCS